MMNQLILTKPLTRKLVATGLTCLNFHYPEAGHTPQSLSVLATDWLQAFNFLNDRQFDQLMKAAKMKCRFFPKIADLTEEAEELRGYDPEKEFLFCGYCVGSIKSDCHDMKQLEQSACEQFSYHAGSPFGMIRLKRQKKYGIK